MNLRHVLHLFTFNLKIAFRDRGTLFWSFAFPVALLLLFTNLIGGSGGDEIPLYAANGAGGLPTPGQRDFGDRLDRLGWEVVWVPAEVGPAAQWEHVLRASGQAFRAPLLVVLPADFDAVVAAGAAPNITASASAQSPAIGPLVGTFHQIFAQLRAERLQAAGTPPGQQEGPPFHLTFQAAGASAGGARNVPFYLPGILAMNVLFAGMVSGASTFAGATGAPIMKRLVASPLTKREWVASNLLGLFISLLIGLVLLAGVTFAVYGVLVDVPPLALLIVGLGMLFMFSLGVFFARTFTEPVRAVQMAPGISLLLLLLSGYFFPRDFFPHAVRVATSVLPTVHLGDTLRYTMTYGSPEAALPGVLVLGVAALLTFPAAVWLIRWGWD